VLRGSELEADDHGAVTRLPNQLQDFVIEVEVRLEMVGDKMLGKVDDLVAWGSSDLFKSPKMSPDFTVGGASAEFRNLTIREATLNPDWEKAQAKLPAPGSKLAAPAPTKAKKKG
jgi:hypothetical protein